MIVRKAASPKNAASSKKAADKRSIARTPDEKAFDAARSQDEIRRVFENGESPYKKNLNRKSYEKRRCRARC